MDALKILDEMKKSALDSVPRHTADDLTPFEEFEDPALDGLASLLAVRIPTLGGRAKSTNPALEKPGLNPLFLSITKRLEAVFVAACKSAVRRGLREVELTETESEALKTLAAELPKVRGLVAKVTADLSAAVIEAKAKATTQFLLEEVLRGGNRSLDEDQSPGE